MIKKFLELLQRVWFSFKKALWEILNEDNEEAPRPPESQIVEQSRPQQSQFQQQQREAVRPVSLGIASTDSPKYRKNKSLLTKPEHVLYQTLLQASNNEYMVFAKVRMGDFVFLANEPRDRKFHVNQVLCKHVDFLFCDNRTLEPLLVVELDDSSHKQYVQSERDEFKNKTFQAIGLPYLRIALQQEYDWKSLQIQIKEKLEQK